MPHNAPGGRQQEVDKDVADLCKERGLDYLKETRDLIEVHLDKWGQFLKSKKDEHPDLYSDFKMLRLRADIYTFYAKAEWFRATLEASDLEADEASSRCVPGLELAFASRHVEATVAKHKSLSPADEAGKRRKELEGLAKDVKDAEEATNAMNGFGELLILHYDNERRECVFHLRDGLESDSESESEIENEEESSEDKTNWTYKRVFSVWKELKETGKFPKETSLNKFVSKPSGEKNSFWSYLVDIFESRKAEGLRKEQEELFCRIAAYARLVSLLLGAVPRVRLTFIKSFLRHGQDIEDFASLYEENLPPRNVSPGAEDRGITLEECNRFSAFCLTHEKLKLKWRTAGAKKANSDRLEDRIGKLNLTSSD